jgi:hypothetical protein
MADWFIQKIRKEIKREKKKSRFTSAPHKAISTGFL